MTHNDRLGGFDGGSSWLSGWCADGPSTRLGVGDFNGDGRSDLFCNDATYGDTYTALSNGAGGFAISSPWLVGWCANGDVTRFGAGDFNGDGKSDLYCNDIYGNNYTALSNGSSAFVANGPWITPWCANRDATRFGAADVSGDGRADLYCNDVFGNNYVALSPPSGGAGAASSTDGDPEATTDVSSGLRGTFRTGTAQFTKWCSSVSGSTDGGDVDTSSRFPCDDTIRPPNAAVFVDQSVPATMVAGELYPVSVTIRNTGTRTWRPGQHALGSTAPLDNDLWGLSRVDLTSDLPPGAEVRFEFTVTAPTKPGPYVFAWGMFQEFVERFEGTTPPVRVSVTPGSEGGGQ